MIQTVALPQIVNTQDSTKYSAEFNTGNIDDSVVKIISSAGDITVTQQGSVDGGANWYDIENGAGTVIGTMVATMTVGTKVVTGGLKFAPSSRFKVVENDTAATNVDISVAIRTKI